MLTFLVEDGTGVADATSYLSVEDYEAYVLGKTGTASADTDAEIQAALIRATAWIDAKFGSRFPGVRRFGREQGLAWPRLYAVDRDRYAVPYDAVPVEVQRATALAAMREVATAGSLSPDIVPTTTSGGAVKRKKLGPMEIEYTEGSTSGVSVPQFPEIEAAIAPLLVTGAGANTVLLVRA